jgi:hypothetical protein
MTGDKVSFFGGPLDSTVKNMEQLNPLVIYLLNGIHYEYHLELRGTVSNVVRAYVYGGERIKQMEETA